ncbi:MAG: glycosyltransferase [Candidatus Daviesbacteria bacterium]|nr:glycosyltransferase [Candidatus Daviesbacteria bacterium]
MFKNIIDLAIIIPTLNEEHFIGYLLDSIAHQSVLPKEIVVVDAYSRDKTISEIRKRIKVLPQLQVFRIPRYTISRQRNLGVKQTTTPHLLFLDADTELRGKDVLKRYFQVVLKKKPDLAMATNKPSSELWKDKVYFRAMDLAFKISKPIWPMATCMNMYIRRSTFEKIGGFDDSIAVGEDLEIVHRVVKSGGKFSIISDPSVHTSPRRFEREGRIRFLLKSARSFIRIARHGYRNNPIEYEFGHFTAVDQPRKHPQN